MTMSPVTLRGRAAADAVEVITKTGKGVARFRMAATPSRFDAATQAWVDGRTEWFTVLAYRPALARNVVQSIKKGDAIVVVGRLSSYEWELATGGKGFGLQIVADAIGHDCNFGRASFVKTKFDATGDRIPRDVDASETVDLGHVDTADLDDPAGEATGDSILDLDDVDKAAQRILATAGSEPAPVGVGAGLGGEAPPPF